MEILHDRVKWVNDVPTSYTMEYARYCSTLVMDASTVYIRTGIQRFEKDILYFKYLGRLVVCLSKEVRYVDISLAVNSHANTAAALAGNARANVGTSPEYSPRTPCTLNTCTHKTSM